MTRIFIGVVCILVFILVPALKPLTSEALDSMPAYSDCTTIYYTYVVDPTKLNEVETLKRVATFPHKYKYSSFKFVTSHPNYILFEAVICGEPSP